MNIKSIFKAGMLALASGLLLVACGTKSADTTPASSAANKKTVTLATVGTTKPFSFEKDGELTGYDIEVAKAVFEGSDYDVTYQKTEWSSIFAGLDSDRYQIGANNISYSDERAEKYLYSAPIATNPLILAVNKNSGIKSYADIAGKSTQVVQGTATADMLQKYNEANPDKQTTIEFTKENIAPILLNLDNGKYDYKIFETQSVKTIVEEQGLNNIEILELDLDTAQKPYVYFLFGKEETELQAFANKRIKELYEDGTLEKLSQEFLGGSYLPEAADIK
ncbi:MULTISPECIES: amino acid ABC transporter substrate-binding protein [unclassified Streptococcus]|uniref:amino acid ABC transporter substrate-binding protein n=1 Tax=unclassified Streptococcus TaxID=2608887 RepID=UPI00359E4B57